MSARILIVRTDRMGDVILSTPVIRALRKAFPEGYLAMMVAPRNRELLQGHPDLNSVIVYDKEGSEKSWAGALRFARELRKHRFDTALILHSTNRVILTAWLAGIRKRVGYARRLPWLLTRRLPYVKREGIKHELDYNLDLLHLLGVRPEGRALSISVSPACEKGALSFLKGQGVDLARPFAVLHPGASCPSKRWPAERFSQVADHLIENRKMQVIVVTGPGETEIGRKVLGWMRNRAAGAFGTLSVGELAWLLRKAQVLISNDSGPVHLGCAVGTPVVAIFGRWGGGLSPTRWGPTGEKSAVLHHDVGCRPCLAHRCPIDFVCLKAVSVEEVLASAESVAGFEVIGTENERMGEWGHG